MGEIEEQTSPCNLTPLTVLVDGFLNFSPVAPGNWAVTDVSNMEPEVKFLIVAIKVNK